MLGSCVYAEKSGSEPSTSQRKLVQMGRGRSTSPRVHQDGMLGSGRGELPRGLLMSCLRLFSLVIWTQKPGSLAWVLPIALQPLLEMQFQRALPGSRAMLHNSSLREGMAHVEKTLMGRDREGVWVGAGGALTPNTSSPFPPEPPGASGSIIPVYCALLAAVVLGLLACVAFKCWHSHKQRQQLAKARTAELGGLDRDQMGGDSCVFLDSPSGLEPCTPDQGPNPELGYRLYLHLPRQQQEEVEQLLEAAGKPDKGWQGLAGRLGYQAEAVETLLRDWAIRTGNRAILRVLEDALAAMDREDVARILSALAEGCSVV
ncbi:death domain-containing membrane protein NRADD-like isoform 6-T8 [Dugong dugon]